MATTKAEPIRVSVDVVADTSKVTPTGLLVAALVGRMLQKVEVFNASVRGQQLPATPRSLTKKEGDRAVDAFQEEIAEFRQAVADKDPLEQADALLDLVFFALGRLAEMGVPAKAVMQEIERANLSKERGSLTKRPGWEGFDAVKPEGWKGPDHSWLLNFSLDDLRKAREHDAMGPTLRRAMHLQSSKGGDYNNVQGGRDAYFPFGHLSYVQMLLIKTARLQSLVNAMAVGKQPNHEGIVDSVDDLVNYGIFYGDAIRYGKLQDVPAHFAGVQQ